jgi:carbon storage regulator
MLVFSRKPDESIVIGDNGETVVTIISVRGDKVRVGIAAPRSLTVHRREVFDTIQRENGLPVPGSRVRLQRSDSDKSVEGMVESVAWDGVRQRYKVKAADGSTYHDVHLEWLVVLDGVPVPANELPNSVIG